MVLPMNRESLLRTNGHRKFTDMVRFLFVRHGKTAYNERHLLQGQTDIPLSETGIKEAELTRISLLSYSIDEIYTSPLLRAKQTADIIARDRDIPVYLEPALIEMNFGTLEGKCTYESGLGKKRKMYFTRFPGGENYLDVASRIYPFLKSVEEKHRGENKTVLLVGHMGIYRVIRSYFIDMTNEEFEKGRVKNAEVVMLPQKGDSHDL